MIFIYVVDNVFYCKIFNYGQVLKFLNFLQFKVDLEIIGLLMEGIGQGNFFSVLKWNLFFFQKVRIYFSSVKVDMLNVIIDVYNICDGNNGKNILVRDKSYIFSYDNEFRFCCNYEYFVFNVKC